MATPSTTAPLGSVTFPTTLPVVCAEASKQTTSVTITAAAHFAASCKKLMTKCRGRWRRIPGIVWAFLGPYSSVLLGFRGSVSTFLPAQNGRPGRQALRVTRAAAQVSVRPPVGAIILRYQAVFRKNSCSELGSALRCREAERPLAEATQLERSARPRNRLMHEAGAYPTNDAEILGLLAEMQDCLTIVLSL